MITFFKKVLETLRAYASDEEPDYNNPGWLRGLLVVIFIIIISYVIATGVF